MKALVADASVVAKCLLPESGSAESLRLLQPTRPVLAPELVYAEVANALRNSVRREIIRRDRADWALALLEGMSITALLLRPLTSAALTIALEHDHPVYDCYYIAAAIQHDASLATADERLYDLAQRVGLGDRAILVR